MLCLRGSDGYCDYYVRLINGFVYLILSCQCCLRSCMLSVASGYLGQVVASDSKRGYLCSIMPLVSKGSDNNLFGCRCVVATREKTMVSCSWNMWTVYLTHFA